MWGYLPPDFVPKILARLPIRSLIQFTAVCKEWRSIITSPSFISAHLTLSRQNPLLLTLAPPPPTELHLHDPNTFLLNFDTDPPLRVSQTLHCPFISRRYGPFRVVGTVDGLILLSDDLLGNTSYMLIWNPLIRKSITLPRPRFDSSDELGCFTFMLGFGLDSASGDYKVVRLVYLETDGWDWKTPPLVEVFSLRDRSWRTISTTVDYVLVANDWTQCFIHGAVHWVGCKIGPGDSHFQIGLLVFDMGKEEFKKMTVPEGDDVGVGLSTLSFTVSVIRGLLSVFVNHLNVDGRGGSYMNIWAKRDYFADSWTKMVTVDFDKLQSGIWLHLRSLYGNILTEMGGGGEVLNCRDIQGYFKPGRGYFVLNYTESLVLLDQDEDEEEGRKKKRKVQETR